MKIDETSEGNGRMDDGSERGERGGGSNDEFHLVHRRTVLFSGVCLRS